MNCLHIICLRFCFIIHHRISDCAPEDVSKALARTLEDLQLDYIDLYLVWFLISNPSSNVMLKLEMIVWKLDAFDGKLFCHRYTGLLGQSQDQGVGTLRSWLPYVFQRHGMRWKVYLPRVRHVQLELATFRLRNFKTCSDMQRFHQQLTKLNAILFGNNLLSIICANLPVFISQ
jgi:hypothetical protein